jgi:CRISPR/Cas system-associated endonuclease Cas3-HD
MAKMTMHQELDMLREEVETLKKQKAAQEKEEAAQEKREQEAEKQEVAEAKEKAEKILNSMEEGKTDAKEALDQLMDTIKNDYENLSPTSAIVLFALGAAFGHALSSK